MCVFLLRFKWVSKHVKKHVQISVSRFSFSLGTLQFDEGCKPAKKYDVLHIFF